MPFAARKHDMFYINLHQLPSFLYFKTFWEPSAGGESCSAPLLRYLGINHVFALEDSAYGAVGDSQAFLSKQCPDLVFRPGWVLSA